VILPIIDWEFRKQRPQHLALQLQRAGFSVTYVRKEFWMGRGSVQVDLGRGIKGLFLPGPEGLSIYRTIPAKETVDRWLEVFRRHFPATRDGQDICLVQWPFWADLALALKEELGWSLVYDCLDEYAGFPGIPAGFAPLEDRLIRGGDLILATSEFLFEKCAAGNDRTKMLRNGVDLGEFSREAPKRRSSDPRERAVIGYVGAISDWFSVEIIKYIAQARPDWRVVLVGLPTHPRVAELARIENVSLLGEISYHKVPRVAAGFDVGTIPFDINPLTRATNPVKVYEYLALGLPVVATAIPEVVRLGRLVYSAGDPESFLTQIERALQEDSSERRGVRRGFARRHSWERVGGQLLRWLGDLPGGRLAAGSSLL
jgi:glycosyltransferase involved in cell wall biosynthesis